MCMDVNNARLRLYFVRILDLLFITSCMLCGILTFLTEINKKPPIGRLSHLPLSSFCANSYSNRVWCVCAWSRVYRGRRERRESRRDLVE